VNPAWRRAAGILAAAVVLAAGCTTAGVWQLHRHEARSAEVALVAANYDADPLPLADVVDPGTAALPDDDAWRPVAVTGRYVGAALLRNRPVAGTAAVHALGVLEVADGPLAGRLLVVDRGWLPAASADDAPAPPAAPVDVVVRLRAAEAEGRGAPPGQVQRIAPAQVVAAAGGPAGDPLPLYGVLASEDGAPADGLEPLPRPSADLGPHLSYAFQWWVFATGALVGAVVLLRRDAADAARAAQAVPAGAAVRTGTPGATRATTTGPRRGRRRPTAEDEEDAILDAAERARAEDAGRGHGDRPGPA